MPESSEGKEGLGIQVKSKTPANERVIVDVKGAKELGFAQGEKFDLFFTDSRLVSIWVAGASVGVIFGLPGLMLERAVENRVVEERRERRAGQLLDTLLSKDRKNYQIAYNSLKSLKVEWKLLRCTLEISYGAREKKKYSVSSETLGELFNKLSEIKLLEGKLAFSVENAFYREL
jgi:hypothetical protein